MEIKKSVIAGMMICIASVLYVIVDNHIIGAIMFAFGLLSVFELKLNLITGKAVDYRSYSLCQMAIYLMGNIIGCIIITLLSLCSAKSASINENAYNLCMSKFSIGYFNIFCSGILCGILMAIAVRVNQLGVNNITKTFVIIICIACFILIGGEHCIADISYMMLGTYITIESVIKILIIILGNMLGSIIVGEIYGYN